MEMELNIELDNNTLDQYEFFLSKFDIWKQYKRELKLSILLNDGKNIEFTVDIKSNNLNPTYLEYIDDDIEKIDFDVHVSKACAFLNSVKFILNVRILNTNSGREIQSLLKDGFEIKAKQIFLSEDGYNFVKFYLTNY